MRGHGHRVGAHLHSERTKSLVGCCEPALLVPLTCHVPECSQQPCEVGMLNRCSTDTLVSSNGDATTHPKTLWWESPGDTARQGRTQPGGLTRRVP